MASFCQTYQGHNFYPQTAEIPTIDVRDIAHHLSLICRFHGAVRCFYSVAQHCVLVSHLVPQSGALPLAALLHDSAEAYVSDLAKPVKLALPDYQSLEKRVSTLLARHFDLDFDDPAIHDADLVALATERRDLMLATSEDWSQLAGIQPVKVVIEPWGPEMAEQAFLTRFAALVAKQ